VQKHRVQTHGTPTSSDSGQTEAGQPGTAAGQLDTPTRARWLIILVLFFVSTINYADRATLSIVGTDLSRDLRLDAVTLGYLLSAFSWTYVALQIPGGWLLDRAGSRRVYRWSLLGWSAFTMAQAVVSGLGAGRAAFATLFGLRLGLGAAEAPSFPANSRLVAVWFPTAERGLASAIFNSSQYFSTVLFYPIMGAVTYHFGWPWVFVVMGAVGLVLGLGWNRLVYEPADHPLANAAEVDYIRRGGGLVDLDRGSRAAPPARPGLILELLKQRMLLGIFLGQYCINVLTWFFLTWFPIYLVRERGMSILQVGFVAVLPALCGFLGGILGGWISDGLLRSGRSLSAARKIPIVAGLLLSTAIVGCNYVDTQWAVIALMSLAFFGKGVGALGWAVMSDVAPKEATGLAGGLFNTCGNLAGIVMPIVIGYILKWTGSFEGALVYVGIHALIAVIAFLVIVGEIRRIELPPADGVPRR
jgi:MFS transporter, ACS family, glucarate transporter